MDRPLRLGPVWTPAQVTEAVDLIDQILALGDDAYRDLPQPEPLPDGTLVMSFFNHVYSEPVHRLMDLTREIEGDISWDVRFPEDEVNGLTDHKELPDPDTRTINQVWRFLAFLTRAEHWGTGYYASAIKDGRLAAARDRLRTLSSTSS